MIRRPNVMLPGLPLFTRELLELAARRRTFLLRAIYALVFVGVLLVISPQLFATGRGFQHLGMGRELFSQMMLWELGGVFLVMPLLTCGAIAQEKERDTLQLLLLTHIRPHWIVVQKLLSRSLVMITLLLVALPITAYAFSLGGVPAIQIVVSFVVLSMTTLVVGSWTLMWSAWCGTTAGALVAALAVGLPLAGILSIIVVPAIVPSGFTTGTGAPAAIGPGIAVVCVLSVVLFVFLQVATTQMIARAHQPARNLFLEFFRGLDQFFTDLNDATTGGIVLLKDRRTLPGPEPIAWREASRKSLGQMRYLLRVMLAIEIPTVLVLVAQAGPSFKRAGGVSPGLTYLLWAVVAGIISVKVSSLIAGERSRQTLDVLLATPLTGANLLGQYLKGTYRMMLVLSIPFVTIEAFRIYWSGAYLDSLLRALGTLLVVAVYFLLCGWIALFVGLRIRHQLRATILATLLIQGWILLPGILLPGLLYSFSPAGLTLAAPLFPSVLVIALAEELVPFPLVLLNCLWYGAIAFGIRWFCLSRADAWLGRSDSRRADSGVPIEGPTRSARIAGAD